MKDAFVKHPKSAMLAFSLAAVEQDADKKNKLCQQAVELGFWGFPLVAEGPFEGLLELDQLQLVQQKYVEVASEHIGTAYVCLPPTANSNSTFPIILILHGEAQSPLDFILEAFAWAKLGRVAVAVPGADILNQNQFRWPIESIDATHAYLQAMLQDKAIPNADLKRVFLLGFSQGGSHAIRLVVKNPRHYFGAVALSPQGRPKVGQLVADPLNRRRTWISYGAPIDQTVNMAVASMSGALRLSGWPCELRKHAGSQAIPEDWDAQRVQVSEFLIPER